MTIAIKDSAPKVPTQSPFGPSHEAAGTLPDLVLITADKVAFYTHRRRLSHASSNSFGGLLFDTSDAIHVPESGTCIDLALRIMYGFPCAQLVPALEDIVDAVAALTKYGISVQKLAAPFLSLYQLILAYAPHRSIEVYALAGHYGLEELAVAVSSHLLAYDTSMLSDELSIEMGPIYIRRLFELHAHRRNALRNIVLRLPTMHPRTNECTEDTQWQLTQAWAYAAAEIVWEALPSMSPCALQSAFEKNGTLIKCRDCREMLHNGIQEAMYEWSSVRSTI
ncbi:hypothetical protein BD309DRAFT_974193 [Dichomitus squalens]|uniref:Uncharacterized protein n=2 Tax=Dichomitus squalens TaxID=114155 RepID=A0A4Q9PN09_9APHY|nr:uncharacterized protein DICSQDRAFT_171117 [Dichomitus squalens LYAD-421 SS1]EJF60404.1 hypothetical protein DICSQDRAFT_171117 [Dichomitus squalens LYAD-421 SS1]TBU37372.1 hypothetical protein BD309DRAFT_974193 [Dichomitus squalens]TBU55642.1 hypothetical protein BD310DRAFT_676442 [Dichomitus squalens]